MNFARNMFLIKFYKYTVNHMYTKKNNYMIEIWHIAVQGSLKRL